MSFGPMGLLTLAFVVAVAMDGCATFEDDCYGFRGSEVTFSLVEGLREDTRYQSDDEPWGWSVTRAQEVAHSCETSDIRTNVISIAEHGQWINNLGCDNHYGRMFGGIELDYSSELGRDTSYLAPNLQSAFHGANLYASGRSELFEGCPGWYSVILYSGPQYYAGRTVPEDRIFEAPTPGLPPNWLVLRLFEPDGECEDLELAPDTTWCADTWVAKIDSIEPR